jgi:hypothetical protein
MLFVFVGLMAIYGLLCFVFAFVEPPSLLRSSFRVPSIFVFLPDRLIMPAGRVFVGICSLFVAGYLAIKVLPVAH